VCEQSASAFIISDYTHKGSKSRSGPGIPPSIPISGPRL
jgi:hypothetical protein